MRTDIVFTLTGPDRVGIVEDVTEILAGLHGNVSTSRMTRLGGEFAILMLVTLPVEQFGNLEHALAPLTSQGYKVSASQTRVDVAELHAAWTPYRVSVEGADHEGIIHEIAHGLSQHGISIESMETGVDAAPTTGTSLFTLSAIVVVPPGLGESAWLPAITKAAEDAGVDLEVCVSG